jgi:hypothetical protein
VKYAFITISTIIQVGVRLLADVKFRAGSNIHRGVAAVE